MDNTMTAETACASDGELVRIYLQYRAPLLRHLHHLVGDADTAQDLYQDTFVKVLRHREQLATVECATAWLFRIASNTAYDHLRRRRRSNKVSLDAPTGEGDQESRIALQCPGRAIEQPGSAALDAALDTKVALDLLPAQKRRLLVLYYYGGYSLDELTPHLASNTGTLRSRLSRARELFKQIYSG